MSINSVVNDTVTGESVINALKPKPPAITGYAISGVDDTALDPAGGQTILLNGTGFQRGATVTLNGSAIAVVTYVNANQLSFTSPAVAAGTYTIYAVNADGGTGIYIPGLIYSNLPTWTTGAGSLGSYYETQTIASNVAASGDAPVTYSLFSGALPTGAVFNANGTISGSAPVDGGSTTYSFTVQATDAQSQDSTRSFSLTINTDVVTWSSPASGATYTPTVNSVMANIGLTATSAAGSAVSYSANSLPTGVSLSGNTISGTPTSTGSTSTLLTATATATSRSATRTINWTIAVASDSYFGYNTLLLQGADTFVKDSSSNNFAVSIFGDTKPNSFNPYTPGYYSNYFDGSGDWIALAENALVLGASNFTFEAWIYPTATGQMTVINGQTNAATVLGSSFSFNINGDACYLYSGSSLTYSITSPTATVNAWSHVAFVRTGNTFSTYLNGARISTTAGIGSSMINTGILGYHAKIGINGGVGATSYTPFTGYISNLRGIIGSGGYDATQTSITVPTSPLSATANTILLTCQSNRFVDNSTTPLTLTVAGDIKIQSFDPFTPNTSYSTYGSAYIPSAGTTYISAGSNTALALGSGNFTIEAWVYLNSLAPSYTTLFDWRTNGSAGSGIPVITDFNNNGTLAFAVGLGSGFTQVVTSSSTMPINRWFHFALVRDGSTITMYFNGVSVGSGTDSSTLGVETFNIANPQAANYNAPMYVSNVRLVKGTAVYTTAFTPPSAPLTAIANTSLLTLQNNQSTNNNVFLDNSSNNFSVTRNGNTTQGSFSPYGGNWSNYFDGNGDNLSLATATALGTGNTTVEFWFYPTDSSATYRAIYDSRSTVNTDTGYAIFQYGLTIEVYGNGLKVATSASAFTVNNWVYVALVRTSGTCQLYINGVASGSSGTYSANLTSTVRKIGDSVNTLFPYIGYISNLREVTSALYSGTFTPSTTPLTPITNTVLLTCQSNRIVDASINNFAVTKNGDTSVQRFSPFNPASVTPESYGAYFDGTGDYLTVPSNSAFAMGTGDFTIECWVNTPLVHAYNDVIIELRSTESTSTGFVFNMNPTGIGYQLNFYTDGGFNLGSTVLNYNVWNHCAVTRSGTTVRLFSNGVLNGTFTKANNFSDTPVPHIGVSPLYSPSDVIGYFSNLRVIKGTALYTTTFTPSTTPLTTTSQGATASQVSLLTCQSPTFIDNSTNNFAITAVGNTTPTQQNPFGYTSATTNGYTVSTIGGSAYFGGSSSDYLSVPGSVFAPTGNFSIMFWCYVMPSATGYMHALGNYTANTSTDWMFEFNFNPNGSMYVYNSGGATQVGTTGTIRKGEWTHVAMIRSGTTVTAYLNGVSLGTRTQSGTFGTTSKTIYIGGLSAQGDWNGYITDVCLVNGTALYTSNFVPQSAPQTAVRNTNLLLSMTGAGVYDASTQNLLQTVGDARLSTAVTKFGASSMSFDGTGDYLTMPSLPQYSFGGNFTVEAWVYLTADIANSTGGYLTDFRGGSTSNFAFGFIGGASVTNMYAYVGSGPSAATGSATVTLNVWNHVAYVRNGSTVTLYLNGTANGTFSTSYAQGATNVTICSRYTGATEFITGYIDDLRVTRGVARYTANFTPPTEAFMTK